MSYLKRSSGARHRQRTLLCHGDASAERSTSRITWTLLSVAVASVLVVLSAAASARADGPYEPNETLGAAAGPLPGGTAVTAARETENDEDWFYFYSSGPRQLDIQIQVSQPP